MALRITALYRVLPMTLGLFGLLIVATNQATSANEVPRAAIASAPSSMAADLNSFRTATLPSPFPPRPSRFKPTTLTSFQSAAPRPSARTNPYALQTELASSGALWTKWRQVRADIDGVAPTLERCRKNFRRCSAAARRFVAVVKQAARLEGRDRLSLVNRAVNKAGAYMSDADQWRRDDVWSAPLTAKKTGLFETGKGDCEDYAIAKYVALREAGVASADLQILMVKDTVANIHHAALAARVEGQWLILDNRWSRLLDEHETAFFKPLFALTGDGVMRFDTPEQRIARISAQDPPA